METKNGLNKATQSEVDQMMLEAEAQRLVDDMSPEELIATIEAIAKRVNSTIEMAAEFTLEMNGNPYEVKNITNRKLDVHKGVRLICGAIKEFGI